MPALRNSSDRLIGIVGCASLLVTLISCGSGSVIPSLNPAPAPAPLVFSSPGNIPSRGLQPTSIALGDFNGDGKLDIVVSNSSSDTIAVFLNQGDGTFGDPVVTSIQVAAETLGSLAVGDFNEDGKADVVVAAVGGLQAGDIVLLGNGDGTFKELAPIPNSAGFFQAKVADLNGDKHLDLITTSGVFLGKGDGTFPTFVPLPGGGFGALLVTPDTAIGVGDFNGDGKLDIVASSPGAQPSPAGELDFYAGNGDGTLQPVVAYSLPPSAPGSLAVGDFNNDGKLDLLVGYPNMASIVLGNGDGTFQLAASSRLGVYSEIVMTPTLSNSMALQTGDFGSEGKTDALVGDYNLGTLTLVLNSGIGQFPIPAASQFQFSLSPGIAGIAVGDLNGDGHPDIAVVNSKTNEISVIFSTKQ